MHMNQNELLSLIHEAMEIELNASHLYGLIGKLFPEDSEFWVQLSYEEKKHASLMKNCEEYFLSNPDFPEELFSMDINQLREANSMIKTCIDQFTSSQPSKAIAFKRALEIEESSGEIHYQKQITGETNNKLLKIFQTMYREDTDHLERIREYMEKNDISL